MRLEGIFTALIVPFLDDKLDIKSFKNLLEYQMKNGVKKFVLFGSTGEGGALTLEEQILLLDSIKNVKDRLTIVVNIFSNSASNVIKYSENYKNYTDIIDAFMVVVPFYNNPSKIGIIAHFQNIAKNISKPIIIYNVPSRVKIALDKKTILELSNIDNIIAIKDASGDLNNIIENNDFFQLTGNDDLFVEFQKNGGNGIISVSSHIFYNKLEKIYTLCKHEKYEEAIKIQKHLEIIHRILSIESNPIPIKYALYKLSIISSPELRLPLTTFSSKHQKEMDIVLQYYNLLK